MPIAPGLLTHDAAAAMGRRVRGRALVAKDGFSARYDLDRVRGVFSRPDHRLTGQSYVGRILVLDAAKGGDLCHVLRFSSPACGGSPADAREGSTLIAPKRAARLMRNPC